MIIYFQKRRQRSSYIHYFLTTKHAAQKFPDKERHWYSDLKMGINTISQLFKNALMKAGVEVIELLAPPVIKL